MHKPLRRNIQRYLAVWSVVGIILSLIIPLNSVRAATITVTTTADTGAGSLRQAILDANANPNGGSPDTINFNITGTDVHTIAPASALPDITDSVIIDGLTQPGASCAAWPPTLRVELDATNAGNVGLRVQSGSLTLRGLVINRYSADGVFLEGSSGGNVFECNFIGANASGTAAAGSGQAAIFANGADNNVIGGPSISQRNLIAGNNSFEQLRMAGSNNNVIQGNYIGTNVDGTAALGGFNSRPILITGSNNRIGGTTGTTPGGACTGACNVIVGGSSYQIWISSPGITNNVVQGNHIGVSASGSSGLGSTSVGIQIDSGSTNTTIGSADPAGRNVIGASTQAGIVIDGAATTGTVIQGNYIGLNAAGNNPIANPSGIIIRNGASNNTIGGTTAGVGNAIAYTTAGVNILAGTGNRIRGNRIFAATGGSPAITFNSATPPNDIGDGDTGPNNVQNFPVLFRAASSGNQINIVGRLNSTPGTTYDLDFYRSTTCDNNGQGHSQSYLGSVQASSDDTGNLNFDATLSGQVAFNDFVSATATDPNGNTSLYSGCLSVGPDNDSWPEAYRLPLNGEPAGGEVTVNSSQDQIVTTIKQRIDLEGRSRWYRFRVQPGETLSVTAKDLPANYDLVVYNDVQRAYDEVLNPTIGAPSYLIARQEVESSPGGVFSGPGGVFSGPGGVFSGPGGVFSGPAVDASYPDQYVNNLVESMRLPGEVAIADGLSQEVFDPVTFAADELAVTAPTAESKAFARAQRRSIISGSGNAGPLAEQVFVNTWLNDRDFYVRVRGRDGAFDRRATFTLQVARLVDPACSGVYPGLSAALANPLLASSMPARGSYKSAILYDSSRLAISADMLNTLGTLRGHSAVNGVLVDVNQSPRVRALNALADDNGNFGCVYAKQIVAETIREIVRSYRSSATRYVVIVGGDDVIPFFRYPDLTEVDPESSYVPPAKDQTAAQAALQRRYILSQDAYGAFDELTLGEVRFPVADLAVGRLAETEQDILGQINAFLNGTTGGVVAKPDSALVTGYDFLADGAMAVADELNLGLQGAGTTTRLISDRTCAPNESCAWTGDRLKELMFKNRYDMMYLAGHFDAYNALAADFKTSLTSNELLASSTDLTNAIVFSPGCHSGYNVPASVMPPWFEPKPDMVQVFARKGATLIANTGYQYGSAYTIDYGERLYVEFSKALRGGSGPVAVGDALLAAKRTYAGQLGTSLKGVYQKAYLVTTLYGLPMLAVDMPGQRLNTPPSSIVNTVQTVGAGPGQALSLGYADATIPLADRLSSHTITLADRDGVGPSRTARYLTGSNGQATGWPDEPILPVVQNDVTVSGRNVQGVVFLGGSYTDLPNQVPLVAAPATELQRPAPLFNSTRNFPAQFWQLNTYETVFNPSGGRTRLTTIPAQYRSNSASSPDGTLRRYDSVQVRLYYSGANANFYTNGRLLSGPPVITHAASVDAGTSANFDVYVVGDPAAGVQDVLITWTDGSGAWQSLPLSRNAIDTSRWTGSLPLSGVNKAGFGYIVQAVSGVGLVAVDDNAGAYYGLGATSTAPAGFRYTTALTLASPPTTATFGDVVSFSVTLKATDTQNRTTAALPGALVTFNIGGLTRSAVTDTDGRAQVSVQLNLLPTSYSIGAAYNGGGDYSSASAVAATSTTVVKQSTSLMLNLGSATVAQGEDSGIIATLKDGNQKPLFGATVFFIVGGANLPAGAAVARTTDFAGAARLGALSVPPGSYTVRAYFAGAVPAPVNATIDEPVYKPAQSSNAAIAVGKMAPTATTSPATNITATSATLNGMVNANNDPTTVTFQLSSVSGNYATPTLINVGTVNGTADVAVNALAAGLSSGRIYYYRVVAQNATGTTYGVEQSFFTLYPFNGFFQPVDNLPTVNQVKAGLAVPIKFSLGGNFGLDIFAQGYPKSQLITCGSNPPIDSIEETVTAGASNLQYDAASNTYTYAWKTDKAWANSCRQLVVQFRDGTVQRANFTFTR